STVNTTNFVLKDSNGKTVTATVSYNSTTYTATLTPSAPLANAMKYTATINNVLNTARESCTERDSWSFTTAAGLVPTATSATPAASATGVATNATVTATFNEAAEASTVNTTNFVLKDSNGKTVTATVSYNSTTYTATLTPSALLANAMKYTATINNVL